MTPDSGRALRAVDRGEFFPAIIKQFNWICSYAGELVVWISISMPSHKSYFQVHWALSSAKLILHDMPRGLARCFFPCRGHPDRHQRACTSHTRPVFTHIQSIYDALTLTKGLNIRNFCKTVTWRQSLQMWWHQPQLALEPPVYCSTF